MPANRYRLRAAEQRILDRAIEDAHRQAEVALSELRRIGDEVVVAALPPEAHDEARRAWVNRVLRSMIGSVM
jgi:hypothetical protein